MRTLGPLVAIVVLFGAACSDDGGEGDGARDRSEVIAWLIEAGETPEAAACFADELAPYSVGDFEALVTAPSEADIDAAFAGEVERAVEVCVAPG